MFLFKFKCMACGLHFMVTSWHEDWPMHAQAASSGPYCPECGQSAGQFMVWSEERKNEQIFEHVPGTSGMRAFGLPSSS